MIASLNTIPGQIPVLSAPKINFKGKSLDEDEKDIVSFAESEDKSVKLSTKAAIRVMTLLTVMGAMGVNWTAGFERNKAIDLVKEITPEMSKPGTVMTVKNKDQKKEIIIKNEKEGYTLIYDLVENRVKKKVDGKESIIGKIHK